MSLADEIDAETQRRARLAEPTEARTLILDIERVKGEALVEFFDLSDFKNRRIHADDVTNWPRTICAAWRWHGQKRIYFAAEWEPAGVDGLIQATWDAYNAADVVVGHNLNRFDTLKLKSMWAEAGLTPPKPWRTVDTLTVARQQLGMESNTLDALCKRFGLTSKTDRYDHALAKAACNGDRAAQRKITAYNKGDIDATTALYEYERPWNPNAPHAGLYGSGDERSCFVCGADDWTETGLVRTPRTAYASWVCNNCGAHSRNNHRRRIVTMVPAR